MARPACSDRGQSPPRRALQVRADLDFNGVSDRGHELGHGFVEPLEVQHLSLGARNGHDSEEDEDGRPDGWKITVSSPQEKPDRNPRSSEEASAGRSRCGEGDVRGGHTLFQEGHRRKKDPPVGDCRSSSRDEHPAVCSSLPPRWPTRKRMAFALLCLSMDGLAMTLPNGDGCVHSTSHRQSAEPVSRVLPQSRAAGECQV